MKKLFCIIVFFILLLACHNHTIVIENPLAGRLRATHQLVLKKEKRILLEDNVTYKPPYMQIIKDSLGNDILTLLSRSKNSIYFYNYRTETYLNKISYDKEGSHGVLGITSYYIKNIDSIYIYNKALGELVCTNYSGDVKYRISLRGNYKEWPLYYGTIHNFV